MSTPTTTATTAAADPPLFPPALLAPSTAALLPQNYSIRPLRASDYALGFLDVLRVLTQVGDITAAAFGERFEWMRRREDEYFVIVVADGAGQIVGTGCLVVERK
ncbi:hypothetical protein FGG08_005310, partial [Glutinoglossum americanum]